MSLCAGCGNLREDWTPGCETCTARHYKRAVRAGDPRTLSRHHAIGRERHAIARQLQTLEGRDGCDGRTHPRGVRGRWIRKETFA